MKKQFTKVFFALGTLIISTLGNTQVNPQNMREGENIEYCKQHVKLNELMQNPAYYEQYLKDQQTLKATELALKQSQTTRSTYYIPVVFHVLHVGGNENISDEQIHDAVAILNRDFRRLNADANTVHADFNASNPDRVAEPADIEVEFRLATIAPDGTCFSGITRTFSALTNESDGYDQVDAIKAGNDVYRGEWKGDQYLNIFVIRNADGAAGYTNYPSNWGGGNSMENGIWVLHNYVGSIGTSSGGTSRTLTHEVGHWLNLPHTWGSTNEPGLMSNCSTDDGVSDTPNTIGSQSCKLSENSCGPRANVENYMDYSYCSKMFTIGQGDRMRAALASTVGGRKNIVSASNLAAVGADGNLALCNVNFEAS
ncbi:MAG TPA: M43 family zinc metalloprotease, partial [Crocinitomicaceae bacterium]|nr:M43 family zinc metalloprotease [Crocinitomicaceae bacterium]